MFEEIIINTSKELEKINNSINKLTESINGLKNKRFAKR